MKERVLNATSVYESYNSSRKLENSPTPARQCKPPEIMYINSAAMSHIKGNISKSYRVTKLDTKSKSRLE